MAIRATTPDDVPRIHDLHMAAFGAEEGRAVADLVLALLAAPSAEPIFSFVWMDGDTMLGHVLFTSVQISGCDAQASILCPIGIAPAAQKQGIGKALIAHGLQHLQAHGIGLVMVLGDPAYYTRLGFTAQHQVQPPYPLAQPLQPDAIAQTSGKAMCAQPLQNQALW